MKALLSSLFILIIALSLPKAIFASENKLFETNQTQFLLQTSAAKTLNETLVVHSLSDQPQTIELSFHGYNLKASEIVNQLSLTKHTIDFASLPQDSIELQPFAVANIPLRFSLPESLIAGDYYGTLELSNGSAIEKVDYTIRVLGSLSEKISIEKLNNSGDHLVYRVANLGNKTTLFSLETNIGQLFLPSSNLKSPNLTLRAGEVKLVKLNHNNLWPGFYQTQTTLKFGSKNTETTSLYSFWVNGEFFWFSLITGFIALLIYLLVRKSLKNA